MFDLRNLLGLNRRNQHQLLGGQTWCGGLDLFGNPNGYGMMTYAHHATLKGEFVSGKAEGYCTCKYRSTSLHICFEGGVPVGIGIITREDGSQCPVTIRDGRLQSELRNPFSSRPSLRSFEEDTRPGLEWQDIIAIVLHDQPETEEEFVFSRELKALRKSTQQTIEHAMVCIRLHLLSLACEKFVKPGDICPLSDERYEDPVFAPDMFIYERKEIEAWLRENRTSPLTGLPIVDMLVPARFEKTVQEVAGTSEAATDDKVAPNSKRWHSPSPHLKPSKRPKH